MKVYVIIDDYTDNPFMDLKVFSDGSEALLELGMCNSLRVYEVEDKALETKRNERHAIRKALDTEK